MKQEKKMSTGKKVAIGAGLAAVGAGAYYLLGPKAKEHQKKASALLNKMKKEVEEEIQKVKEVSAPLYHKAVDAISETYAKQYKIYSKDIKTFAKKLKKDWEENK